MFGVQFALLLIHLGKAKFLACLRWDLFQPDDGWSQPLMAPLYGSAGKVGTRLEKGLSVCCFNLHHMHTSTHKQYSAHEHMSNRMHKLLMPPLLGIWKDKRERRL